MPEIIKECCHNCGFERGGTCRRYPPVKNIVVHARDGSTDPWKEEDVGWPAVSNYSDSDYWCGEWKHPNDLIKLIPDNGS